MTLDPDALDRTLAALTHRLMDSRTDAGYWRGRLAGSALATATATFALHVVDPAAHAETIRRGLDWLCDNRNADGGWGDTPESKSNLSTTLLVWSALTAGDRPAAAASAEAWIAAAVGGTDPRRIARAVYAVYGGDRTFSAPILTTCVLAGRLGAGNRAWRAVAALPFELALCPQGWFRSLRLPVVSYALPALIAIGQVRHRFCPSRNPILRLVRWAARRRTLDKLGLIQPENGGFLEAAPLTSFVTMSLAAIGRRDHPVVVRSVRFLLSGVRGDGSWAIDTDLATWVTTLSVAALSVGGRARQPLDGEDRDRIRRWLLGQQYTRRHRYTGADPGGWAWTDMPGGVPDADDTAGALLALRRLGADDASVPSAAAGVRWLLGLQNRDGGLPTFCRGWGKLPFDRSTPDLTAHTLRAWLAWRADMSPDLRRRVTAAARRGVAYLAGAQHDDGAWTPLWFGNEDEPDSENPTYGTARVVSALQRLDANEFPLAGDLLAAGVRWLLDARNADGGWGGGSRSPSSIEETALATDALAGAGTGADVAAAARSGAAWLIEHTAAGTNVRPTPIGLYFAKLWYHEQLYPLIFAVSALARVRDLCL